MDDSEARYLIDQFNKYASWAVRRYEVSMTVWFAVGITGSAVWLALFSYLSFSGIITSASSIVVATLIAGVLSDSHRIHLDR